MTKIAVFVVGPPGVGKTTMVREILGSSYRNYADPDNGKVKWCLQKGPDGKDTGVVFAGHYGVGTFDGADTVPNDGWAHCVDWWEKNILPLENSLTIFDGDRFSHQNAKARLESMGLKVLCVHLTALDEKLNERRAARGSDQDPTWLKGRVSKARNFSQLFLPEDNSLFDMFSDADQEVGENRLLDLPAGDLTPKALSERMMEWIEGWR